MRKLYGLLVVMLLLTGCAQNAEPIPNTEDMSKNLVFESDGTTEYEAPVENETDEEAYVLTFESFTIGGEPLTSECFSQSKLTMVNVWATYCSPCIEEMPYLSEIAASYDSTDFQIIGIISDVDVNAKKETMELAKELITQTGADYPHLLLSESLYNNLLSSISAVPTSFFVNQEGEVLGYLVGAYSKEDWEEIINELLGKKHF